MPAGRCRLHGGCSTGPRTPEGKARCTEAPARHGRRNRQACERATERGQARWLAAELDQIAAALDAC